MPARYSLHRRAACSPISGVARCSPVRPSVDGDLQRRALREPQGAAEAEHDTGVGERRQAGGAVGRGNGASICAVRPQAVKGPPGHAEASEGDEPAAGKAPRGLSRRAPPRPRRRARNANAGPPARAARPRSPPRATPNNRRSRTAHLRRPWEASRWPGPPGRRSPEAPTSRPPRLDVPQGRRRPRADVGTGSAAIGVEHRQAVPRRPVPAAPGQAEEIVPVLDEPVEHAGPVRDRGHLQQELPAVPANPCLRASAFRCVSPSIRTRSGAGAGSSARCGRDIHRRDQLGRARRQHAGAEGTGHAVKQVERVQVDGARRHGGGAPLRLAGGGGARPQEGEGASEGEAPARPDAAGWTLRTGAPAGRGA